MEKAIKQIAAEYHKGKGFLSLPDPDLIVYLIIFDTAQSFDMRGT